MTQIVGNESNLLETKHRATAMVVVAFFLIVIGLVVLVLIAGDSLNISFPQNNLTILWTVILVLAIGSFILRRFLFAPASLRNILVLKGKNSLLSRLQLNTLILAFISQVIAIIGFIISVSSGDNFDMLRAAFVAVIVLFISFPRKSAWQRVYQSAK
jgi:hypothetical protein